MSTFIYVSLTGNLRIHIILLVLEPSDPDGVLSIPQYHIIRYHGPTMNIFEVDSHTWEI